MQPNFPSSGSSRQEVLISQTAVHTGTIVLGDGSPAGLVFVPGGLLAQLYVEAAKASQGGGEAGGLLMGPQPGTNDVLIQDVIPFGAGYRFGRSLGMSFLDLDGAKTALAEARPDGTNSILGLYRTSGRKDDPPTNDFEVVDALRGLHPSLSNLRCCFLMAEAAGTGIPLRVWVHGGSGWEEVQHTILTWEPGPARPQPEREPVAAVQVSPVAGMPKPPDTGTNRGRSRSSAVANIAGLFLAAAVSGAGYRLVNSHRTPASPDTRIEVPVAVRTGFAANRDGSSWKLTWNSAAVLGMKPTDANLFIQDGSDEQQVALTMADLASGTIYYSPKAGELAFRLQIMREGTPVAEDRVRVLERAKAAATNSYPKASADSLVRPSEDKSANAGLADPDARLAAKMPPARKFVAPVTPGTIASNPILAATAPVLTGTNTVPPPVSTSFAAPPPPQPTSPAVSPTPPPVPETKPASTNIAPAIPQSNYQPPRPTKQVQAINVESRAGRDIQVAVLVSIDANGRVTKVAPAARTADFNLMTAALKAAGFWEFEPARLNGKPVPAQMTLIFRF
jgi:TonB family protein